MVIKLKRNGEYWTADIKDLPGSPVVGIGKTKVEALASLFRYTLSTYDGNKTSIDFNGVKTACSQCREKEEYVADSVDPLSEENILFSAHCIHKYEE
jgi:hypothetical protein